ncbi:MAG TPA: DUF2721 domain-containing protein [Tepidisphaeraceae bacterium]|nr:DUF2721 domain-containing protein [Tepidisphaeraceae bacterium]
MPLPDLARIISASVVPVVIISACGLLALAFYNRLAAIVSRLRAIHRERLHEHDVLSHSEGHEESAIDRQEMLRVLEIQTAHVARRAKLIRLTLFFLLLTVCLLIGCCLMLGLSVLLPGAIYLAVPLFMLGLISMLVGIICAMMELKEALQPAELESRFVSQVVQREAHEHMD